jgi:hypothetical protein
MEYLKDLSCEVLHSKISIKEALKHQGQYKEYYEVESDFKIAGVRRIGNPEV